MIMSIWDNSLYVVVDFEIKLLKLIMAPPFIYGTYLSLWSRKDTIYIHFLSCEN